MLMVSKSELIRKKAIELVKNNPEGLRWSDLMRELQNYFLDTPPNTLSGLIRNLPITQSEKIYKPTRGLFKYRFPNERETEETLTQDILNICKSYVAGKSFFFEELCENLKGYPDLENITEEEVDKNLCELYRLAFISPFEDYFELYIELKNKFDFEKLNDALLLLTELATLMDTAELEGVDLLSERPANFLEKRGLKVLGYRLIHVVALVHGSVSLALRRNIGCGILMRTAFELWLNGMLLEHLRSPRFRGDVSIAAWDPSKHDSVTWFLKVFMDESRRLGKSIDETIEDDLDLEIIENQYRYGIHWNQTAVIKWLDRWECFKSISSASEDLNRLWRYLSEEVHGKSDVISSRVISLRFLKELMGFIDLFLVGIINTLKNVAPKSPNYDNSWEKLIKSVNDSNLDFAKEALKRLEL